MTTPTVLFMMCKTMHYIFSLAKDIMMINEILPDRDEMFIVAFGRIFYCVRRNKYCYRPKIHILAADRSKMIEIYKRGREE